MSSAMEQWGMSRRIAGAASIIVVVAVSGCTTTVAGQVVPSGAVKAATVTASAPAAVEPALRWVPYNGPPIELPRDWTGGQIGNAPPRHRARSRASQRSPQGLATVI
jgi:hypothetical protein